MDKRGWSQNLSASKKPGRSRKPAGRSTLAPEKPRPGGPTDALAGVYLGRLAGLQLGAGSTSSGGVPGAPEPKTDSWL